MRLRVAACAGLLLLAPAATPASAEGLFDLLMGGVARPAAEAPADGGILTVHRRHQRRPAPQPRRAARAESEPHDAKHKAEVAIDPGKVADWYLHDRTLRRGDIVVLKSGVLVFTGHQAGVARRAADFAKLREARFLSARTREFVAKATAANATAAVVAAPLKPKAHASASAS